MSSTLLELTKRIRYEILTMTTQAGSGHPTSSLSAVELMTALWFDGHYQYDFKQPRYIFNDRMIFSKGHASPLLYALYVAAGAASHEDVMGLRTKTSDYEGHPTPRLPWVDVATGSLGQGLSVGIGMTLGIKRHMKMQKKTPKQEPRVFVLMGDSEFSEGQIWEALQLGSHYKLNNLVGILDVNRLGQRGEAMLGWDVATYEKRIKAFGWETIVVKKGNDLETVCKVFKDVDKLTKKGKKPVMIIAKTTKGAGISSVANKDNWHGKALPQDMLEAALTELGEVSKTLTVKVKEPEKVRIHLTVGRHKIILNSPYDLKSAKPTATRQAYGEALKLIAEDPRVIVLDAETSNSTYAEKIKEVSPEKFYEMFIAEQNMMSVALGFSKLGFLPFASSFAAFLARAYDQIRMFQYSEPDVNVVGSHAGVSIGEDGSSQMALEDLAMFRALLESKVLYPSDPNATLRLVNEMRNDVGISYLRLTRMKTPDIYTKHEKFKIGGSKVLRESKKDKAVVVAAGITVHEALAAHEMLIENGTAIAVIDAYSVKPIDKITIREYARRTGKVIIVEDHYPYGGLGDAVREALEGMNVKIVHLAVSHIPHSGKPQELLKMAGIDAASIAKAVK